MSEIGKGHETVMLKEESEGEKRRHIVLKTHKEPNRTDLSFSIFQIYDSNENKANLNKLE